MPNGNQRGSTTDRRRRKLWLLSPAAGWGGDDEKVPCWECGKMLSFATLFVDRIIPGHLGGRYRRENVRPHCAACSHREGQRVQAELRRAADPFTPEGYCKTCGVEFWASLRGGHVDGCTVVTD